MFTYLKLTNFKSFGNICFDFNKTKAETKRFIAIYGENGCGKSNFVSAFEFLLYSTVSFSTRNMIENVFKKQDELQKKIDSKIMEQLINGITLNFSKYRMIECTSPTIAEYGFKINGIEGYYKLTFDESIIDEELYYLIGSRRGKMFSIHSTQNNIEINIHNSMFTKEYKAELENEIKKYWGKTSFLGIFFNEISDKNNQYIKDNVLAPIEDVVNMIAHTSVFNKNYNRTEGFFTGRNSVIMPSGTIPIKDEEQLDYNAQIIKQYFCQLYSDVRDVYYEKNKFEDRIEYKLHIKKIISGKVRDVLFNYESSGIKKSLDIINALNSVINGETVIYDEIDDGIHDLLMESIISSVNSNSIGQLIITTHNTLLLETMDPQSAYVIYVDCDGNKEARCCADYDIRIQKTNNMRNQYLKGMFGGIPYTSEIDFSYMTNCINDGSENNE